MTASLRVMVDPAPASVTVEELASPDLPTKAAKENKVDAKRPDIQGLRAIAVIAVVIYHLWPDALPGGYVGVDVFFVISGFLITSHLLRHPPASLTDLLAFWGRRIRRLLPAALLVLSCTLIAVWRLAPSTEWAEAAAHVRAATLYFENWQLASESVDYLQAADPPTAVQHFWSLAVEEQFYLIWPILVLLIAVLARRLKLLTAGLSAIIMAAIVAASLILSIRATAAHPASSYFSTPVRMWELAAGALVAALATAPLTRLGGRIWWALVAVAGFGAIGYAAWEFTAATPFPGSAAAIPVAGGAAVIASGLRGRTGPVTWLLSRKPLTYIGDISYSIYLWHWPLIVLVPFVVGPLDLVRKLDIVSATIILAALTKRFIEDPFRRPRPGRHQGRPRRLVFAPFGVGAVAMLLLVAGCAAVTHTVNTRTTNERNALQTAMAAPDPCFGAAALALGSLTCPYRDSNPVLGPLAAQNDRPVSYADNCWADEPYNTRPVCHYGSANAPLSVALVGNSHAGQWLPALQKLMGTDNFRITTYLASGCNVFPQQLQWTPSSDGAGCYHWGQWAMQQSLAGHFDLIVTGALQTHAPVGAKNPTNKVADAIEVAGNLTQLKAWTAAGIPVLVIRDTPASPTGSVPQCVAAHEDDVSACSGSKSTWLPGDPLAEAAARMSGTTVSLVDFTDKFCTDTTCYGVMGGVIMYSDANHVTATYAATIAPYLAAPLQAALTGRAPSTGSSGSAPMHRTGN